MEILELLGYALATLIGVSLGLLGGGGSILTVPILVYLLGVEASEYAPAYSLFIVGVASLVGGVQKYKLGEADFRTFIVFGIPAIITVYLTRLHLVHLIPDPVLGVSKRMFIMGLFAVLMLLAAIAMIRKGKTSKITAEEKEDNNKPSLQKFNYPLILLEGIVVGVLTGLVGAGGGFLIVPALVKLSKLSMKKAIGTSLLIIAAKSLFGFIGDVQRLEIDWQMLLILAGLSLVGIFIGNRLSRRISGARLKTGFGWFVLIMGVYIFTKEIFF